MVHLRVFSPLIVYLFQVVTINVNLLVLTQHENNFCCLLINGTNSLVSNHQSWARVPDSCSRVPGVLGPRERDFF